MVGPRGQPGRGETAARETSGGGCSLPCVPEPRVCDTGPRGSAQPSGGTGFAAEVVKLSVAGQACRR